MKHSIKLNKGKQILGSIVAIVLVGLGIALLINPSVFGQWPFSKARIFSIAVTLIILFLGMLIFFVYKMIAKQHGLHISEEGIQDQSTALSLGLIEWEEMKGFGVKRQVGINIIVIYLKEPEAFLKRFTSVKKAVIKKNSEAYGTPVAISMALLDIKLEELKRLFEAEGVKHNLRFED